MLFRSPEMEKKIVRNIEKGTGKKARELDLAISTAETDKSLRSLVRTRKQKLKEKEKIEMKKLSADPVKTKKETAVDDQQKRACLTSLYFRLYNTSIASRIFAGGIANDR